MKICIVSLNIVPYFQSDKRSQFGGAEVQAAFVAKALAQDGHQVAMVVADLEPGTDMPYPCHNAFRSGDGVRGLRFFYPRLAGILHALEEADADVYYQRNAGMITGITAMFCRRHRRTFVYGAGSDVDFSMSSVDIHGLRDKLMFSYGLKKASGIVVQNEAQLTACKKATHTPVRMIPNGVEMSDEATASDRDIILWVGAIRRIKQPEVFLELARRMPEQQFVIVGGGLSSEPTFAEQTIAAGKTLANLEVTGRLAHDEVMAYVRRARVLVNTSKFEGFPNVYLEAWRHSVPVATFNEVDGLIGDNELGVVVGTVDDMEAQLRDLLAQPERLDRMGRNGRSLVEARFSPTALARSYQSFFEELMDARGANPSKLTAQ